MKLGIRARLFLLSVGLIAASTVVAYAYLRGELEGVVGERIQTDLTVRARLVAARAASTDIALDDLASWDALADELGAASSARVSIVRRDGVVLGDSELTPERLTEVDNHSGRPEVRAALAHGRGANQRTSATLERRMVYVATRIERHGRVLGVARVALPLTAMEGARSRLRGILAVAFLLASGVAIVMSTFAAQVASKSARSLTAVAREMAGGDLEARAHVRSDDEFGELGRALNRLATSLSETLDQLRTEHDRSEAILEGMREGVFLIDRSRHLSLVNAATTRMLGLAANAIGKTDTEAFLHEGLERLIRQARLSEGGASGEIATGGADPRRLLVHVTPFRGTSGSLLGVLFDVTHLRTLQSLRKDFVDNVSHELRTPITAIQSAAETLRNAALHDPAAAPRFVEMIERNAVRLRALVEDLLDLSRIESRGPEKDLRPIELDALLRRVADALRELAEHDGASIRLRADPDTPPVLGDASAIEQVVTNLIENAVKYGGRGVHVDVLAERHDGRVRVSVVDDGPGIDEAHLSRLFERFYRVDAGRSRELGGTGLGLAIVKHLVQSMGGSVSVESAVGEGSTFSFVLDAAATDSPR